MLLNYQRFYCFGDYTSLVIFMNSWDIFFVLVCVLLVVGLIVVLVNGWLLPVMVYGAMAYFGFLGLMHLFARW
jgi:hypothetical protein